MATIPDELRVQLAHDGIPIAASLADYFRQLTLYGRSALWLPDDEQPTLVYTMPAHAPAGEGLTYAKIRRAREILNEGRLVIPTAPPHSGSGTYGQLYDRDIPDTPLDEWNAGVDALLAECEAWQAQTDEVLHDRG